MTQCSACHRPKPREWCWDGARMDCPFGFPPHHLNTDTLWRFLVDQHHRIEALEKRSEIEHPPEREA